MVELIWFTFGAGVAWALGQIAQILANAPKGDSGEKPPPPPTPEESKENTPDQDAVIQIAKDAKRRGGLSPDEAAALLDVAKEVGLPVRGPESHPDRAYKGKHIHVGPINHIPVR